MSLNIWQGQKVRLRAIEPEDWEYFNTENLDTEIARLCYAIPFPTSRERDRRWAAEHAAAEAKNDAFDFAIENLENQPAYLLPGPR
jgi:hypothetical protein